MPADAAFWRQVGIACGERLGLHYPSNRLDELKRALLPAAAELGLADARDCAAAFVGGRLDAPRLGILASHLTVGETYFMRGDEAITALRTDVLPGLATAARAAGRRSLRIWSAGCCTGEEAYSLAILLSELLPDRDAWNLEILATDLNPRFLERAEAGIYGEWSFRGTPDGFRTRYFRPVGADRYALDEGIRGMVRFAALNLVDAPSWPALVEPLSFDLVVCRNVLMYFTPSQAERVVAAFHRTLRHGGWLVTAPCEMSQPLFDSFDAVGFDGAIFHRKTGPRRARPAATPTRHADAMPRPSREPEALARSPPPPPPGSPSRSPPSRLPAAQPAPRAEASAADPAYCERRARALADRGHLHQALAWCDRWVAADRLDGAAHYLRAAVLAEAERWDDARDALQRCLYLEPDDAMAGFALGNLERRLGRRAAAQREYRNLLAVLQRCAGASLAHGDGITASQLDGVVRHLLRQDGKP